MSLIASAVSGYIITKVLNMAVTRKTPKNIGNYRAKLIGPFSARQCVLIGMGLIPSVFAAYICLSTLQLDATTTFMIVLIIMSPFCVLAFFNPYGMKPEDFIIDYYFYHIMSNNLRLYQTETMIDQLSKKDKGLQKSQTPHKKDKDYPAFL